MGLAKSEGDRLVDLNELARTREELAGEQCVLSSVRRC
jgi:hypothetical protein